MYGLKDTKDNNVVFKYNTDDVVRISKVRGPFTKCYEQNYTHKFFTISERIPRTPPVYKLKDYDGDIIDGCFYEEELQKIKVGRDKSFKVEKILESKMVLVKKMMVLVKWSGWPKFNSWVCEEVVNI